MCSWKRGYNCNLHIYKEQSNAQSRYFHSDIYLNHQSRLLFNIKKSAKSTIHWPKSLDCPTIAHTLFPILSFKPFSSFIAFFKMPGRTLAYFTTEPIFQGYTPEGGYILRYKHKNYVFNGTIGEKKFVEAANVAFDHADHAISSRSGKDRVYDDADHFIIARIGVHITTSYNEEDGHVNKSADKTMHLTMTAIARSEKGRDAEKMYGATGHIPTINVPSKDHKNRIIDNYIYNPRHKDPDTGEDKPWSWFPPKQLGTKNRNALVASIKMLKTSRTPSPEHKQEAAPVKPAPIPLSSPWGTGKGKAADSAVKQMTESFAESSLSGSKREAEEADRSGRKTTTRNSGKARSRSSSQKPKDANNAIPPSKKSTTTNRAPSTTPKSTEQRYDRDGKRKSNGNYVKENGKLIRKPL